MFSIRFDGRKLSLLVPRPYIICIMPFLACSIAFSRWVLSESKLDHMSVHVLLSTR